MIWRTCRHFFDSQAEPASTGRSLAQSRRSATTFEEADEPSKTTNLIQPAAQASRLQTGDLGQATQEKSGGALTPSQLALTRSQNAARRTMSSSKDPRATQHPAESVQPVLQFSLPAAQPASD